MMRWGLLLVPLLAGCMPRADLRPMHYGTTVMPPQLASYPPNLLPHLNQDVSGTMRFLNRDMALPAGTWRVADIQTVNNKVAGLVGAVVALVRTEGTTLRGVLVFAGNARPDGTGFPVSKLCQSSDVIWNDVRAAVPQGEQDCTSINFERMALWRVPAGGVTAGIMSELDLLSVQPPNMVVLLSVHEANRTWTLDETLAENPDASGIAPDLSTQRAQSGWAAFRVASDPAKQRFLNDLKARGATIRLELRRQISAPAQFVPQSGLTPA